MAVDLYGNEVQIGDYIIVTPPHYRDIPFITKAINVGPIAITIEFCYHEIFGKNACKKIRKSVRKGFVRITEEMAKNIMGDKFNLI